MLITVAATVLALFPLALHGGPLWEARCYAQIGGLSLATLVTLLVVPVIYSIFVLDLKIVRWEDQLLFLATPVMTNTAVVRPMIG